jgi:hypothetical protein
MLMKRVRIGLWPLAAAMVLPLSVISFRPIIATA